MVPAAARGGHHEGGATLFGGRPTGLPKLIYHVDLPAEWSLVVVDSGSRNPLQFTSSRCGAQYVASDPVLAEYVARSVPRPA